MNFLLELHPDDKMGMAKVACDLLAKLAAGVSTELFLKRIVILEQLSEAWQAEDTDCANDFVSEEPLAENSDTTEVVAEQDVWELDDDISPNIASSDCVVSNTDRSTVIEANVNKNSKFKRLKSMRLRKSLKTVAVWFTCKVCGFNFRSEVRLTNHMVRRHVADASQTPMPCERCGLMCKTKRMLFNHLRTHKNALMKPTPCSCNVCGKEFLKTEGLQRHMENIHTRQKCVCSECGERFGRTDHYQLHMRRHTGERPYGCTVCGKRFFTGSHLTKHSYIHTGHKPYVCEVCCRGFVMAVSLKKHSCEKSRVKPLFELSD